MTIEMMTRPVPSAGQAVVTGAAPVPEVCRSLLADADGALNRALGTEGRAERFAAAHLAALRAGAAVLATRARPRRAGRKSVWDLLVTCAPELADWALFFAAGSRQRQAIDAGLPTRIGQREADDMVRQAAQFVDLVRTSLGCAPSASSERLGSALW